MDDESPGESSRERATSPEPSSTRLNPFDDTAASARKKQRRGSHSRSISADTAVASTTPDSMSICEDNPHDADSSAPPQTPTRQRSTRAPPEPTSSKVTINLRTDRPVNSDPHLSSPASPTTPSKMTPGGVHIERLEDIARQSVESENDGTSLVEVIQTPSSTVSSSNQSPPIEVLPAENSDEEYAMANAVRAGVYDIREEDPVPQFPFLGDSELLDDSLKRLKTLWQWDSLNDDSTFVMLNEWLESILSYVRGHPSRLLGSYESYNDFWVMFPELVWCLNWRRNYFGKAGFDRDLDPRAGQGLSIFLCLYARLCAHFAFMDAIAIKQNRRPEILVFKTFAAPLCHMLRWGDDIPGSHLGKNLQQYYNWDWQEQIALTQGAFQGEGATLTILRDVAFAIVDAIPQNPKLVDQLVEPCQMAAALLKGEADIIKSSNRQVKHRVEKAESLLMMGIRFFEKVSGCLELIIEKHITALSPEVSPQLLQYLQQVLESILEIDNSSTKKLVEDIQEENTRQITGKRWLEMTPIEWKLNKLKKLLMSTQMQLRVVGLASMCGQFLHVFNKFGGRTNPKNNPVLEHFARFIIRNKIVEYLVGIGSHPEIINESFNIVGFLIATGTLNQSLSDTIWQAVRTSQDPRVVKAILGQYKATMGLYTLEGLYALCDKARLLPVSAITSAMRSFCESLFETITNQYKENIQQNAMLQHRFSLDSSPTDLCAQLIRMSSETSTEAPSGHPEIFNFATKSMSELISYGTDPEGRSHLYLDCIKDISNESKTALGSISILKILVARYTDDLRKLVVDHGLVPLLIRQLRSTIAHNAESSRPALRSSLEGRDLLVSIIMREADTISPESGKQMWNLLVGEDALCAENREAAWQMLISAMKNSSPRNPFISACYLEYLPSLPPSCYTKGLLDFINYAANAWLAELRQTATVDAKFHECHALEQLWRVILTAPPKTIDAEAISILVEAYVDNPYIISLVPQKARAIHSKLVERCLEKLATAAEKLKTFSKDRLRDDEDESMDVVASDAEFQDQEMIFARSLAVLREFWQAYHSKKHFATPVLRSYLARPSNGDEGEQIQVKYQSFHDDVVSDIKSLSIGRLSNTSLLFDKLKEAIGFEHAKVYYGGKQQYQDMEAGKAIEDARLVGLVLVKHSDAAVVSPDEINTTSIDAEIMKHIDELWGYLGMHEVVAREIFSFLVRFPVYGHLLDQISSEKIPHSDIFPQGEPHKSLYAVHALRDYIATQSQLGPLNEASLTRAISLIVAAIPSLKVGTSAVDATETKLSYNMIDCFAYLLKDRSISSSAMGYLDTSLLKQLLRLLYEAKENHIQYSTAHMTNRTFEAILEAAAQNPTLWASFKAHMDDSTLIKDLLLVEPRIIRRSIGKSINAKSLFSSGFARVSAADFANAFWPHLTATLSAVQLYPDQCEEVFLVSETLLKHLAEGSLTSIDLGEHLRAWVSQLLSHETGDLLRHTEKVDLIARGFAALCYSAASVIAFTPVAPSCSDFGLKLFDKHLFPATTDAELDDFEAEIEPQIPLLDPITRKLISDTVFLLIKNDKEEYGKVVDVLLSLVEYNVEHPENELPYSYNLSFAYERTKAIRSSTGYAGLRNLSNTCYLNSLFTQLFMNVPFREFMLNAYVADGSSQRLLYKTQLLFSWMQNSLEKYQNPHEVASSIRTYDNVGIDVNVQMDVDEFYNLLFDRWESQMLAPEDKKNFRLFYGGQLVQQVKSKECEHISERLEPFMAIQCDIKGKESLAESLQAYVDGEIMEGDNKYKCSKCDRHVDAVKRACLKDVPDNLIFHLKRFEFSLRTLQRAKLNDCFTFPKTIDMSPYKVDHFVEGSETPEDLFELVGILVHSGTAESGHYYSYVRERPSSSDKDTWVEFNDENVTPWDPESMENNCFGGVDYRDVNNISYDKPYSAYMLFYQRCETLESQSQALVKSGLPSPLRVRLPPQTSNIISGQNEILMRQFCLYDPSHAAFVIKMLSNLKNINNGGQCSEDHNLENRVIVSSLNFLDQVATRAKDLPDFKNLIGKLQDICRGCANCSYDFLEWFVDKPHAVRQLLLKNPDAVVRTDISASILVALQKVKASNPPLYGTADGENQHPRVLSKMLRVINKQWEIFQTNTRAWPEFFGLLLGIANLGEFETVALIDASYLRRCLEIITADNLLPLTFQYQRMLTVVAKRSTGNRMVSYDSIIDLLASLLASCDLTAESVSDHERRIHLYLSNSPIAVNETEKNLLVQFWTKNKCNILTQKLLHLHQSYASTQNILILLLQNMEDCDEQIFKAICHGLKKGHNCDAFVKGALTYCEHSGAPDGILHMIESAADAVDSVENPDGHAFLRFFRDVGQLDSNRHDIPNEDILRWVRATTSLWAPALLNSYEAVVRDTTERFLDILLFHYRPLPGRPRSREESPTALRHIAQKLGIACCEYLQSTYIDQQQQVVGSALENIERVLDACAPYFDEDDDYFVKKIEIINMLSRNAVEELEENSDWENSDAEDYGSSEPVDSVAEITDLCTVNDDDL